MIFSMMIFYDSVGGRPQGGEDTEVAIEGKHRIINISRHQNLMKTG
jgi:hypothetical protein